jgi:hypothetical protein
MKRYLTEEVVTFFKNTPGTVQVQDKLYTYPLYCYCITEDEGFTQIIDLPKEIREQIKSFLLDYIKNV